MFALFLTLFACSDNAVTTAEPVFDGYHVSICVTASDIKSPNPEIAVSQRAENFQAGDVQFLPISHQESSAVNLYCNPDVVLHTSHDGQALHVVVIARMQGFKIEKVEVTYQAYLRELHVDGFPYTKTLNRSCGNRVCGTIEAWRDSTKYGDQWRFNILSVTGIDGIPTAIVDLPNRRE